MTQSPYNVPPPSGPPPASASGTSTGLDPRLSGVLAYLFWIVGGILFLVVEKQHPIVRFHAAQSVVLAIAEIALYVVIMILGSILWFLWFLLAIFWLLPLVLRLFLMYKAYLLEGWKLPVLGDYAEKLAAKM